MARKAMEIKVWHVFKDGTVTQDISGRTVPPEIARQMREHAERVMARVARERAAAAQNNEV